MVRDVISATLACDYEAIRMTPAVLEALEELRDFMFEHLYLTAEVRSEFEKAQRMLIALFEWVTAHPDEYFPRRDEPVEQLAIDFIAGMTDRYAINLYEELFVPRARV